MSWDMWECLLRNPLHNNGNKMGGDRFSLFFKIIFLLSHYQVILHCRCPALPQPKGLKLSFRKMGNTPSSPARHCLLSAVGNNSSLAFFPDHPFYQETIVKPLNLNFPVTPAAITVPHTAEQIAAIVKCASDGGYKVQAKSGSHSYGNYGSIVSPQIIIIIIFF